MNENKAKSALTGTSLRLKKPKSNFSCRPFWIWSDDKNIYVTESKQNTVYIFLRLRSTCRWNKSNMATFEKSLETKLKTLEPTQTGIQTLSLWIIHHRQHSDIITSKWIERVKKGMYYVLVANHIFTTVKKLQTFFTSCIFAVIIADIQNNFIILHIYACIVHFWIPNRCIIHHFKAVSLES